MLRLHTKNAYLEVSDKHNLADKDMSYGFAEELRDLYGVGSILSKEHLTVKGLYSPKTTSNNFFVFLHGSQETKVIAHCFTHIRNPVFYEPIVGAIETVWNWVDPSALTQTVHPSHAWMHKTFTILQ